MTKQRVVGIVGPTASGKTKVAISLAQTFNGEVISADSRQVYRGLDEGTAKASPEEMQGVPHHLIDVCDVTVTYTAADFTRDAQAAITAISNRSQLPIIAGGTFFYLDQLRGTATVAPVPPNQALRAKLETLDTPQLYQSLQTQDPRRAADIDAHNRRRLIRALEIVAAEGIVPSPQPIDPAYHFCMIGLSLPREELRTKLRKRAEQWLSGPFAAEVEGLLANGVTRTRLQEIGFEYTLMLDYLDGKLTDETFIEQCVAKNWQYAKRQMTWLKRDPTITWFAPTDITAIEQHVADFMS